MHYVLSFLLILTTLANIACGQSSRNKEAIKDLNNPLGDSSLSRTITKANAEYDSLTRIYGDSALFFSDTYRNRLFLEDPLFSFLKDSGFWDAGEFTSKVVKVKRPVKPSNWICDFAHIFTEQQSVTFDSVISEYERKTTNEIAIVTIPGTSISPGKFDSLILVLHDIWGIGKNDKSNGILIGINSDLRQIQITSGKGVISKLSNADSKRVIDEEIIPFYKAGAIFEGTLKGLLSIMAQVR